MDESDFIERLKNTGRNDSCPCGSGKKYKKCHLFEDEAARSKEIKEQQAELEKANAEKEEDENSEETAEDKKANKSKFNAGGSGKKFQMNKSNKPSNIPRRSAK